MNRVQSLKYLCFILLLVGTGVACGGDGDDGTPADPPRVAVSSASIIEGNEESDISFSVRLSREAQELVSVQYETRDLSATAGEDYLAASGSLTFQEGVTEMPIQVKILADTLLEGDEEFELILSNVSPNAVISISSAKGTIRNDDTFNPGANDGYITPDSYAGWTLVWRDEFESASIDNSVWTHETGNHGWGNNEWQNYTARDDNSYISDGQLVIEAKKESFGGSDYTSARMITAGVKEFRYGRVDIRARLPEGQGIWPALWMLGGNFWSAGWPACGEIDIMEIIGSAPSTVHGTIHWENNGAHAEYGNSTTLASGKFSDEFHVFSIIWDSQSIRWLLDDVEYSEADITPADLSEFHQSFFFIFNVAVGGNWPGYPDASTQFPQRMYVDYIRVFQQ